MAHELSVFEAAVLEHLAAIREALEKPPTFKLLGNLAAPSPRTIDEWYEGVLTRNLDLETCDNE